jgi:FkbM family methyltransferase
MGLIGQLAMRLNFGIRRHPSRWLYTDSLLGKYIDPNEQPFFTRDWGAASIWDIGASVGKYTTILARHNPKSRIYAFEPNLNSLYYLAYRTAQYPNVVIVPNALTVDGQPMKGTHEPDFNAPPTGPLVATVAVKEAIAKYGVPTFVKMDIEGGEFSIFEGEAAECFKRSTVLVSWHPQLTGKPVPAEVKGWKNEHITSDMTLLTPL